MPQNSAMPTLTPDYLIELLDLQPHPEGGWYRQTYQDPTSTNGGSRAASTMIYYLLQNSEFSAFHRMDAAEGWHHYAGDPLNVVELGGDGAKVTRLGVDFEKGERPQYLVDKEKWFGSCLAEGSRWALVGCTVAPGFEFASFELGRREELMRLFPRCEEWVEKLTRVEVSEEVNGVGEKVIVVL